MLVYCWLTLHMSSFSFQFLLCYSCRIRLSDFALARIDVSFFASEKLASLRKKQVQFSRDNSSLLLDDSIMTNCKCFNSIFMSRPSPLKSLRPLRPHHKLQAIAARTNRRPQACGLVVRDPQTLEFLTNTLRQDFTTKDFVHKVFKKLRPLLQEQQMDRALMKSCRSILITILQGESGQLDLEQIDRMTWQHGLLGLILGSLRQLNQKQSGVSESLLKSKQDHLRTMIWQSAKQKDLQIKQRLESMALDPQVLISTLKTRNAELWASEKAVQGLQERIRWLEDQRVRQFLDIP